MQSWHPTIEPTTRPIYIAIAKAIAVAITSGELAAGDRLPPHRTLATQLGVDLTTVTRAYSEARRQGLLEGVAGRGTFVRDQPLLAVQSAEPSIIDLGMNLPPQAAGIDLPLELKQGLSVLLSGPGCLATLSYRTGAGTPRERAAGATWLMPVIGAVNPARIVVAPGAQPALLAILGLVATRGDTVLCDKLTYPGIRAAAAQLGIRLVGVETDEEGMVPTALAAAAHAASAKAVYIVPTIQNPTTITLSCARRQALADAARETGLRIIEDDAYGMLVSKPQKALSAYAPEISYHVSTLSKVLSPALRLAYVVAPDEQATARLETALRANTLMASPLLSGLVTAWVHDGTAARLRDAVRAECQARQAIARDILPPGSFSAHPDGIQIWLRMLAGLGRQQFVAEANRQGLAWVASDAFWVGKGAAPEAVRVSLGAPPTREHLRLALRRLAAMMGEAKQETGYIV